MTRIILPAEKEYDMMEMAEIIYKQILKHEVTSNDDVHQTVAIRSNINLVLKECHKTAGFYSTRLRYDKRKLTINKNGAVVLELENDREKITYTLFNLNEIEVAQLQNRLSGDNESDISEECDEDD